MSASKWAYIPERCDGYECCGGCESCPLRHDNEAMITGEVMELADPVGFCPREDETR